LSVHINDLPPTGLGRKKITIIKRAMETIGPIFSFFVRI